MLEIPTQSNEVDYNGGGSSDSSLEFPVVPLSHLDVRRYLYSNGRDVTDGTIVVQDVNINSTNQRLDMELNACDVLEEPQHMANIQLIGNFSGDVTITRVGIRAQIEYEYNPSLKVKKQVQTRKESVGQCYDTVKVYKNILSLTF